MGVRRWQFRGRKKLAALVGLALLVPIVATASGGRGDLILAANAPGKGSDMTVFLGVDTGAFGRCDGEAAVEIELAGQIVLPSVFGRMPVADCRGTLSIPYARFAGENGVYLVRVSFDGMEGETRIAVEKFVDWLFVRAFPDTDEKRLRVDFAFDRALGQPLVSGVFASGTLVTDIWWEECTAGQAVPLPLPPLPPLLPDDCKASHQNVYHSEIPIFDEASTHVFIDYTSLDSPEFDDPSRPNSGWYNVTATFHNDEALGNYNVPMDPTVLREDPPGNWFEVSYE